MVLAVSEVHVGRPAEVVSMYQLVRQRQLNLFVRGQTVVTQNHLHNGGVCQHRECILSYTVVCMLFCGGGPPGSYGADLVVG